MRSIGILRERVDITSYVMQFSSHMQRCSRMQILVAASCACMLVA